MSVFRVEKNKGYTVMSNHHLRNHALSLKAKGLLSQMLSLPEDWDYTLQGLAQIPIVRQRQHLREESFGLERQRMVAEMVVGHDRVTFGLFNTEYRHFCDLLRLRFQI